jgi:hypothetical protein
MVFIDAAVRSKDRYGAIYGELLKLTLKDIPNLVQNQEHRASTFVDLACIRAERNDARASAS